MHSDPPTLRTLSDAEIVIDSALATTSHALRTKMSQVTGYPPGALSFYRDVLLDIIGCWFTTNKKQKTNM